MSADGDAASSPPARQWRRVRDGVLAHPVLVVSAMAVLVGVVNVIWTASNRRPGGLDIDEVSYLAQAFEWQRLVDPAQPFAVYSSVLDQDKGPVTMLVSVITLLVGPNTVATAMAASAVLHGVGAVAVAGITNRLAGARAAMIAGLVVLALPAALVAARSYQLAPAVGASLALAVWALLASSRGQRLWPMVGFGASVGLLVLSRTMAVAFVPGLALAAALHLDWSRRTARNAAASLGVALLVAGPWWWLQRESILDYLLGHGYGAAAGGYGASGVTSRVSQRVENVLDGAGAFLVLLAVVVVVLAAAHGWRRRAGIRWIDRVRSGAAVVWLTVGFGTAALVSTANAGMYFELPLMVLAVAGFAALGAGLGPLARRSVGAVTVAVALITLSFSWVDSGGRRDTSQVGDALQGAFFIGLANYQYSTVEAEPRLGSRDRAVRLTAMDEWWDATLAVLREMDQEAAGSHVFYVGCGSGPQISVNSFLLAGELDRRLRDSPSQFLSSSAPPAEMEAAMEPTAGDLERLLVIMDSRSDPFPGEVSVERCADTAQQLGWRTAATVRLPDGGTADVMIHPENE